MLGGMGTAGLDRYLLNSLVIWTKVWLCHCTVSSGYSGHHRDKDFVSVIERVHNSASYFLKWFIVAGTSPPVHNSGVSVVARCLQGDSWLYHCIRILESLITWTFVSWSSCTLLLIGWIIRSQRSLLPIMNWVFHKKKTRHCHSRSWTCTQSLWSICLIILWGSGCEETNNYKAHEMAWLHLHLTFLKE